MGFLLQPFFAVLFLWHGAHHPPLWILATIVIATVSRFALTAGLWGESLAKPNPARFLGALSTYICGLIPALAMLPQA